MRRVQVVALVVLLALVGAGGWWMTRARWRSQEPASDEAATSLSRKTPVDEPSAAPVEVRAANAEPASVHLPTLHGDLALAGRVVDESGKPVAGATVKLASEAVLSLAPLVKRDCDCGCGEMLIQCQCARAKKLLPELVRKAAPEPPAQATVRAGADGVFAFQNLPRDRYRVWAQAPGKAIGFLSNVEVGGAGAAPPALVLPSPVEIHGKVLSSANEPLHGVTLVALSDVEVGGIGRIASGADGSFAITPLARATYYLYATARGFASGLESDVDPGSPVVIRLDRGAVLAGKVEDVSGTPVGDAVVQLIGSEGESPHTRADGSFRIEDLTAGEYKVWAEKGTQTSDSIQKLTLARGEVRDDLVLKLDQGARLEGRALSSGTDTPLDGLKVGLHQEHRGAVREGFTDDRGHYALDGIPPGTYTIQVDATDARLPTEMKVTLAARETRTVDLMLERGATLEGVVHDASGQPIEGAAIEPSDRSEHKGKSDPRGEFRIEGLTGDSPYAWERKKAKTGTIEVQVTHPGFVARKLTVGGLGAGETARTEVVLERGGSIRGSVLGPDNAPLDGIAVALRHHPLASAKPKTAAEEEAPLPDAKSKGDGRFELRGVPEGDFDVEASGKGMVKLTHGPVTIAAEQSVDGLVLRLERGEVIEGQVLDSKGEPVNEVTIWAKADGQDYGSGGYSRSDRDGRFHLDGLASGTYSLEASREGFGSQTASGVRSGTTDARIVLKAAATLVGRVVEAATGKPLASIEVNSQPVTTTDGRFEWKGLGEETDHAFVGAPGFVSRQVGPFAAGSSTTVDAGTIALDRSAKLSGHVVDAQGRPQPGRGVSVTRTDGDSSGNRRDGSYAWDTTDTDGAFALDGLSPGRFSIVVRDDTYQPLAAVPVSISGSGDMAGIVVRLGDLAGMHDVVRGRFRRIVAARLPADDARRLGPAIERVGDAAIAAYDAISAEGGDLTDRAQWMTRIDAAIPAEDRTREVTELITRLRESYESNAGTK